jgi:hypothetical protein
MKTSFFEVTFKDQAGEWQRSRLFQTICAARTWARWLSGKSFVADVAIHRGGAGGELVS